MNEPIDALVDRIEEQLAEDLIGSGGRAAGELAALIAMTERALEALGHRLQEAGAQLIWSLGTPPGAPFEHRRIEVTGAATFGALHAFVLDTIGGLVEQARAMVDVQQAVGQDAYDPADEDEDEDELEQEDEAEAETEADAPVALPTVTARPGRTEAARSTLTSPLTLAGEWPCPAGRPARSGGAT